MEKAREFHFTESDFDNIRDLVHKRTGINLSKAKMDMVYSRLARRLRQLGIERFSDYTRLLDQGDDDELVQFTNAITTNLTSFFREPHHFTYLEKTAIPGLLRSNASERRLRIWSAGCSTGEEPYTLAITLMRSIPDIRKWDVKILATDLDSQVLEKAKAGVYTEERISGLDRHIVNEWFVRGRGDKAGQVKVKESLQDLITFKQLNLIEEWPMKGPFDVIFCRNVVIYFDKDTQRGLFDRYADILRPDGHIMLGHSETMFKVSDRFQLIGQTIYRKIR